MRGMPVRFVIGRAGTGKTHFLRERLVDHVRPDPLGARVIYLVPRQATFLTQRAIATDARLGGYTGVRIVSPDQLAETAMIETGRPAGARLDAAGRSLLIGHLLRHSAGELEHFGRSAGRPGLAGEIDRTFGEFERAGRTPDELVELASESTDTHTAHQQLGRKLRDLSRLYGSYQSYLIAHGFDPYARQLNAPGAIADWAEAKQALVLVDDFYDFTVYERQIITALAGVARQTFVAMMFDAASPLAENANLLPKELSLFGRTEDTYRRLHFALKSASVPIEPPLRLATERRPKSAGLRAVAHALDDAPYERTAATDDVRFCLAGNARDELEVAAREIKRLLFQGFRLRDICVLARSADGYAAQIEAAFSEHGVPYFLDRRRPAAHHPLVTTIQAIGQIVQTRWSHDGVFDLLKAGLTGVEADSADLLADYVTQHRLTASAWPREERWEFNRMQEDEARRLFSPADLDEVNRVATLVRTAVGPLVRPDDIDTPRPISQRVIDLTRALDRLAVRPAMLARINAADDAGEVERREEETQVWSSWTDLCDRFHELLGDVELTGTEFFRLLQTSLDGLDLSIVPPTLDQVLVGSVDRTRVGQPRAVIVIGLNECDFPLCQQERAILNDADRVRLMEAGLEVEPPTKTALLTERFLGYVALTRAAEKLVLIRTECDKHGQDCAASPFWDAAAKVLTDLKPQPRQHGIERIASPAQAVSHLLAWARKQSDTIAPTSDASLYQWIVASQLPTIAAVRDRAWPALAHRNGAALSSETANALFTSPLEASVSRFESFAACPFQHFARYGLRLQRSPSVEFTAMDLGNLYHAVLETLVAGTIEQRLDFAKADALSRAEVRSVSRELAKTIGDELFLSDARSRFTLDQLDRTVQKLLRAQQVAAGIGQLRPSHTELTFGPGPDDTLPPVEFTTPRGHTVRLRGKIDRVDTNTGPTAYSVIDYKLGGEQLDYGYVAHGLMLQLLTYLLVLREHGPKLFERPLSPAAALYVKVLRGIKSVDHPDDAPAPDTEPFHLKEKPRGVIGRDWATSIDPAIAAGVTSKVVAFKLKQDGDYAATGNDGVDDAALADLIDYVRRQIADLADQIIAGNIAVAPYMIGKDTPCQRCDLQRVCRIDRSMNRYQMLEVRTRQQAVDHMRHPTAGGPA